MVLLVALGTTVQTYVQLDGGQISRTSGYLWYVCFSYTVAWWVEIDRRAKNIGAPFEYAAFMFFVWPLLAPYYLFKSRRWRGVALGAGLIMFSSIPDFVSVAVYYWFGHP